MDHYANLAYSTVAAAPAPPLTGTKLTLQAGAGGTFPAPPFVAFVAPQNALPLAGTVEVIYVTAKEGDQLTFERHTQGSTARAILAGDQIYHGFSEKTWTDLLGLIEAEGTARIAAVSAAITTAEAASDAAGTAVAAVAGETVAAKAREKAAREAAEAGAAQALDARGTTPGDLLTFAGGSFVRLAAGSTGQQLLVRSDGTLHWQDPPEVNARVWGVVCDGATDDQAALNEALSSVQPGTTIRVPTGTGHCRVSKPIVVPPCVRLVFPHANEVGIAGYTESKTFLKPLESFVGSAVVLLVDKEIGGYANDSCEQQIQGLTIDGSGLKAGNSVDGIRARGKVHAVKLDDIAVRNVGGHGLQTEPYKRLDASEPNPFSWRVARMTVENAGKTSFVFESVTDATVKDCISLGCEEDGWFIHQCGNSHFTDCRAEWSKKCGFRIKATGHFNHTIFTGLSTDRNEEHGVLVFGENGTSPIIFNGMTLHRDGRNNGVGGGGFAGLQIENTSCMIVVNGITVAPGVDDNETGTSSPEFGFVPKKVKNVTVASGSLWGFVQGWHDGGENEALHRSPNVEEFTGVWTAPVVVANPTWNLKGSSVGTVGALIGTTFTATARLLIGDAAFNPALGKGTLLLQIKDGATPTEAPGAATLSAVGGKLVATDTTGAVRSVGEPATVLPTDHNLAAWTFPPWAARSNSALATGVIYLMRVPVRTVQTLKTILFNVTKAATTATNESFIGLYGPTGVRLGRSLPAKGAFEGGALREVNLEVAAEAVAAGYAYLAILWVGTGTPELSCASEPPNGLLNVGLATEKGAVLKTPAGKTELPAAIIMSECVAHTSPFWVAVK